jgi:hypothetical protein
VFYCNAEYRVFIVKQSGRGLTVVMLTVVMSKVEAPNYQRLRSSDLKTFFEKKFPTKNQLL